MITDALVNFIPVGSPQAITVTAPSNVIDLLGSGVGTRPRNIIGNATTFGQDVGIGGLKPQIEVLVTTAFGGGTSLQVQFQAAASLGAPTYLPDTWVTLVETPAILQAQLTAQQVLARFDYPPAFPAGLRPRYLRLNFVVVGPFNAGAVQAPTTMVRDDQANKFQPRNYVVA